MNFPTPTIDARQPTATPPVPNPGFAPVAPLVQLPVPGAMPLGAMPLGAMPLGAMPFGAMPFGAMTPAPVFPYGAPLGVLPAPIPPFGISPFGVSPFGMLNGVPPAPITPMPGMLPGAMAQAPIFPYGTPLGIPQAPVAQFGVSPYGTPLGAIPPAPFPGVIPPPSPMTSAASFLLSQIALKQAASKVGDEALKARVIAGANEAITRTIEDLAGVTLHPWFKAAALGWIYPVAVDLALLGQTYPEGPVRAELITLASQLLGKGLSTTGEVTNGVSHRK